jgi:hypothetical protein
MAVEHESGRMIHKAFIGKSVYSKKPADPAYFGYRAGQEMPTIRVGVPLGRIFSEDLGLIVNWVEGNGEQYQIPSELPSKSLLQDAEIIRDAEAIVGKWTACINEIYRHHLAGKLRKRNTPAILIDQCKVGNCLPDT